MGTEIHPGETTTRDSNLIIPLRPTNQNQTTNYSQHKNMSTNPNQGLGLGFDADDGVDAIDAELKALQNQPQSP